MSEFLIDLKRTHDCGGLRGSDAGKRAVLFGWVSARRDHGGCVFIDLRDRGGLTQVVFEPGTNAEAHGLAGELRGEFCVGVAGVVVERGGHKNPNLPTGEIEVKADKLTIFSRSETPPFEIVDDTAAGETVRLKHRYLDLRRPALQRNFLVRSTIYQTTRRTLAENGFVEIETPFMVKYTPGGARNFLVPSRLNPHQFYALAESPQIFKQLFMVAGMDRYFQIVRCFRDEDLRLDRQPEFTQIDLEMSFVAEEDVQGVVEKLMAALWKDVLGIELTLPFPRLSYTEAMDKYGSDKPDLRFELPLIDLTEIVTRHDGGGVGLLQSAVKTPGGIVKGWRLPAAHAKALSRADLDKLEEFAKGFGARGLARARIGEGGVVGAEPDEDDDRGPAPRDQRRRRPRRRRPSVPAVRREEAGERGARRSAAARRPTSWASSRAARARRVGGSPGSPTSRCSSTPRRASSSRPTTRSRRPNAADIDRLESDPGSVRARAYDLVLNGNEIAGGSIRIHRSDLQARVFRALGLSDEDANAKFGFLLEAFKYGPPPHGGIAAGVDRLAMLLCGADSLRDVIAFPKTQKGTDMMTEAPGPVAKRQLDELHIALKE